MVATCDIMAAAANRNVEIELMGQLDGRHDIGHTATARNQRRALVDQAVIDSPCRLVAVIMRLEEQSAEIGRELVDAVVECWGRHGDHPFRESDGQIRRPVQNED
jgi:hypothetical protein